ncbi:MAG: Mrp/NBP35 family ATP-binding protein [Candidatus Aenigmatarchaeota archaeon]|nr:MAG: Mrp/NBP35 family ATP-binding protein [Candidatus Aenigmarchaeota archaeon]
MPLVDTEQLMESTYRQMELSTERMRENLKGVRIVGVHSGKGGVGKTTVAINVAVLLAKNKRVGLLDADIDCPNVPKMLGITGTLATENGLIQPAEKHGIKVVSTALMRADDTKPFIMRGPMKHHILMQLLARTNWGPLDVLVIDLPPGTSDVPLSVMQLVRPDGIVCVTTPQDVAVLDAKKSINMARSLGVRVLGIVENMSGDVFGAGGGERAARELGVTYIGSVALNGDIVKASENGAPAVEASPKVRNDFERILEAAAL